MSAGDESDESFIPLGKSFLEKAICQNCESLVHDKDNDCYRCKERKPTTEFHKNKVNNDGFQSYCISCQKEANKESKQRTKENPVKKARKQIKDKISISKKGIYIPVYGTTITPEEVKTVFNAVAKVEYNYVPTTESICKETGYKSFKVRAVLLYLLNMNRIKKSYSEKHGLKYTVV